VNRRGRPLKPGFEVVPLIPGEEKPHPPEDMTDAEKDEWARVVASMPLRYFGRETWPLLKALCRHAVAANIIWQRYNAALVDRKKDSIVEILSRQHARETAAIRRLSADLRLSKSVRSQPIVTERAKQNQVVKRPWEDVS